MDVEIVPMAFHQVKHNGEEEEEGEGSRAWKG
jgi:hypothetical protein